MKNVILIDGTNLLYRSYYATAYTGTIMRNKEGFPTNALYGFISMLNKIIHEEKPSYIAVAFDIGKNFRHEMYTEYKAGRSETPKELKEQISEVRPLLEAMGIKYYEVENYEADDIIGALANEAIIDEDFVGTIISSDKDLLQLISPQIEMKLLKQKDFIRYNEKTFENDYGFLPINIIDYKALCGDASDNIPGVKGIGEKTALKLISEYKTIENLYEHIDDIKGSLKDKLILDQESAIFSKKIATIVTELPVKFNLEDTIYNGPNSELLIPLYEKYGFKSLLRDIEPFKVKNETVINYDESIKINKPFSYYIEANSSNYHYANILGMGVYDGENAYFVNKDLIEKFFVIHNDNDKYTYDLKKNICLFKKDIFNTKFDLMLGVYMLGNTSSDIATLAHDILLYNDLVKSNFEDLNNNLIKKAKYIFNNQNDIIEKITSLNMLDLFNNIEMPLISVLAKMEMTGIKVDLNVLNDMKSTYQAKIDIIENKIYDTAMEIFNISSPKQLGEILFDKLKLPYGKKTKTGYSTDVKVLNKLKDIHPIIPLILDYRNYKKMQSTYLEGLGNYVDENSIIHTIYKQNLTRTGRLSSIEPNLQNIPVRDEEGRKIRQAFIPQNDYILSCDYSQIELRLLAHLSSSKELLEAFKNGADIHTEVASKLYGVDTLSVTKEMRKNAKAVVFGIVYGISDYGLSEGTDLSPKEAHKFINKYFEVYPSVKEYMDNIIKKAYEQGYVTTLFNRRREIEELKNSNYMVRQSGERIALNTPIQGLSADIIKKAMIEIDKYINDNNLKSKMILQVHDELIFDVIESEKDKLTTSVIEIMDNVVSLDVELKVGSSLGKNWYEV